MYLKQGGQLGGPRWSRSRNQGNMWIRGELRISNINGNYQIVFEGVSGKYSSGVCNAKIFLHEAFIILTNEM